MANAQERERRLSDEALPQARRNAASKEIGNAMRDKDMALADLKDKKAIVVVFIGTDFEIRVWETLLKIPMGRAVSYGDVMEVMNVLRTLGYLKVALVGLESRDVR